MIKHYKSYYFFKYEIDILDSQVGFIWNVLQNYCFEHGSYPSSSEDFIKYINMHEKENYHERSPELQKIMRYGLGLKVQKNKESIETVYLYSMGPDYKNDSLTIQINAPAYDFKRWSIEVDFLEFLFAKGDILLGQTTVSCYSVRRSPPSGARMAKE
ncbi:MAG: hypothetical protein NW226_09190 [Microscillaceae bacterium]|nr:hypothetical protein [Microscillaceae bacterium]